MEVTRRGCFKEKGVVTCMELLLMGRERPGLQMEHFSLSRSDWVGSRENGKKSGDRE